MWTTRKSSYEQFRYGSPKPVTLPSILEPEKRRHVIYKLMDVLADWRMSPFQYEGECRAGVRSSLCLAGHPWDASDNEAAKLTRDALNKGGAVRPDWDMAQRTATTPRDVCAHCGVRVPPELMAGGLRRTLSYCSQRCARRAILDNDLYRVELRGQTRALDDARDIICREANETRECAHCHTPFRPRRPTGRYCSLECTGAARQQNPTLRCLQCNCEFVSRPSHGGMVRFCSTKCKHDHGMTPRYAARCEACGCGYKAKLARSRFCGPQCKDFWKNNVAKGKLPKFISPRVFDYLFIASAPDRSNVIYLTPAIFDGWFRKAA